MTFIPDDDDRLWKDSKEDGWYRFSNPWRYVLFILLLVGAVIIIWYLTSPARRTYNPSDLALIRADDAPFKVKAKDQEIPSVKHQDKLVYGRIRESQNEPMVEHILPDPEQPLTHLEEDPSTLKMVNQYQPDDVDVEKVSDASPEPTKQNSPSLTSIEDLIGETPKETPQEKPPLEKKAVAKGKIHIQLGSLKNYDMAEAEWGRLSKKHQDIFGGLNPVIQKVDLGEDKGIYYRLRTGPFESDERAKSVCASLKDRKVECLVIH